MAGSDASEGQAVWQPGGAEEDSRLREGNRHLHLAYDDDEEEVTGMTRPGKNPAASGIRTPDLPLPRRTPLPLGQRGGLLYARQRPR